MPFGSSASGTRHKAEEKKKETTGTFGGQGSVGSSAERKPSPAKPMAKQREESPGLGSKADSDAGKPKSALFKKPTSGPFAKKGATSGGFGGAGNASGAGAPKSDGLFYPGAKDPPQTTPNQFNSIGSFGARNDSAPAAGAGGFSKKGISDRDRKSSSNIEEVYSDDNFEEESLGNSQLNVIS